MKKFFDRCSQQLIDDLPLLILASKGYGTLYDIKYKMTFAEYSEICAFEQLKSDIEKEKVESGNIKKSFS